MYEMDFKQFYAEGQFSTIYRVSEHRIVKVYNKIEKYTTEEIDFLIKDEINGSKLNYGLSVIKEVVVSALTCHCGKCQKRVVARGLLKRFIPFEVTEEECEDISSRFDFPVELKWDAQNIRQMRKDEQDRIYVIDTQTEKIMHLVGRK